MITVEESIRFKWVKLKELYVIPVSLYINLFIIKTNK